MKGIIAELVDNQPHALSKLIEELASNRFGQLSARDILHLTNCTRSFKVNHVALVTKPNFKKVKHRLLDADRCSISL